MIRHDRTSHPPHPTKSWVEEVSRSLMESREVFAILLHNYFLHMSCKCVVGEYALPSSPRDEKSCLLWDLLKWQVSSGGGRSIGTCFEGPMNGSPQGAVRGILAWLRLFGRAKEIATRRLHAKIGVAVELRSAPRRFQ